MPEMANTDMQIERLHRIAALSGGKCLGMLQMGQLVSLLDSEPHSIAFTTEIALWDNGWIVFLLIGLTGFEWIVRRRYDLS